jgi:putative ABC transport system permease protein
VAIATAALFSLLAFQSGYQSGIRGELDRLGAHILVVPKGCPYDAASMALHGASWPCFLKSEYLEEVRSVPGVATAAPVFMTTSHETNGEQVVYAGVQSNILALKSNWRIRGKFPGTDGEILAGAEAARIRGWNVGDRVDLPGVPGRRARVTGILGETQGADDTFVYLDLEASQRVFCHSNELTHILVRLVDPENLDRVVSLLRGCEAGLSMNVVPLAHVFHTIQSLVFSTRLFLGCLTAIALLVAAAGVSNSVLMAVAERQREIGVLRAIGASPADVIRLICLETIQVCAAGAAAGVLIAFLASRFVENWVRAQLPFAPTDALIHWEWWVAGVCMACALVVGLLASLLPAARAARIPPVQAMRAGGMRT